MSNLDISIVVPLYNEAESLQELTGRIADVMQKEQFQYEVLLIDDGSTDGSWDVIKSINQKNKKVQGVSFRRNYGKSAALNVGFGMAKGNVVITMDADLQDSPEEIPELYQMIVNEKYHLVSGWKKKRYDPISKTIPTKLFNRVTRCLSGIKLHDFNCGLKAYAKDVVKNIEVYGEMHRYIPVIAKRAGFAKIGEKAVKHSKRRHGKTKFGIERFLYGFLDLLSITFVTKFGKRPMHLFGGLGTLMFFIGFLLAAILGIQKLLIVYVYHFEAPRVTDRALFYIALVTMILGTQLFLTGFLAELTSRNSAERNDYKIADKT